MASKRKLGEGVASILTPKPKKKYNVTETKSGDKPWWVKEGLGRKPPKSRKKKPTPVVTTKTNGSPKTTPPVKKGVRGSTIAGAALIGSGAGLIGYTGPLVYNEMMRKKSHKVKSGDTLSQIAKRHGTTLKALLAANPQIKDANKIRVGQKIKLSRPVKGRKSVYQGMSKSEMAKMAKKKSGGVVKKQAGGGMTRVGLSPAEMARAGTMSEADRRRYMKKGGKVGKKKQGYKARKDESIAMRVKKKRTKKQLKASRNESYGKWGKGKGKGKINRSGAALVASSYD